MVKNGILLGLGPIVFGLVIGVSYWVERDLKRASIIGTVALSATYAGGLAASQSENTAYRSRSPYHAWRGVLAAEGDREVAVFWDYENVKVVTRGVKAPLAEALLAYTETKGHPRLKMVYANWRRESDPLVQALYSLGFEPIHVSTGKENSVDIKLTVDCLNAAYQYPEIRQFIVVTADRDFVPLVNALKNLKKTVTLIGRTETASDQLLLSADEFIDLEKLAAEDTYAAIREGSRALPITSYQDAVQCLIAAINQAREQGKSTRFGSIDLLMRTNPDFPYRGVSTIRKPNGETFANFSAFIAAVEAEGKVKVQAVEDFKELFLPDEDPETESEFIASNANELNEEQWQMVLRQVQQAFVEGQPGPLYGRFLVLFSYVRQAKKDGRLPLSNAQLRQALSRLVAIGVLVEQADQTYRLIEAFENRQEELIQLLMEKETSLEPISEFSAFSDG